MLGIYDVIYLTPSCYVSDLAAMSMIYLTPSCYVSDLAAMSMKDAEDGYQPLPNNITLNQDTPKTQSLPRGMQLEEPAEDIHAIHPQLHRATCDYKRRKEGELDLKVGTVVDVLECNQSGQLLLTQGHQQALQALC